MPSTYSPSLKIELIGNGEQSGTWGQTTNNNMGTLIEQAITGVSQIPLYGGDYTLTNYNGLPDESRNAVLVFSGSLSAPANVITPAVEKTYIVTNNSGANVTIKTATGNGVTILNGLNSLIYCDGTDFYTAVNVNNVIGDLTVSGNVSVAGGFVGVSTSNVSVASGNLALTSNSSIIDMSTNTGAFIPPTGTAAQRPSNLALGMSRWNTDTGVYEVWNGATWQIVASGSYSISYLLIAGGGGGGINGGGGGGAGGVLSGTSTVTPTNTYPFVIGSGGGASTNGVNSTGLGLTALGGGGGGTVNGGAGGGAGFSGGSGGGGGWGGGGDPSGGAGTSGQGSNGGSGAGNNGFSGGGGGGKGGGGGGAIPGAGGGGGSATTSTISGTSSTYAGGGGGGNSGGGTAGSGGGGGAGNGANGSANGGTATANTGSGGGGGGGTQYGPGGGGSGGSGIAIVSYANPTQRGSGGAVSNYTTGGTVYWVHTFLSSGTFTA